MSWQKQLFSVSAVRNEGDEQRLSDGEHDEDQVDLLDGDIAEKILQVLHFVKQIEDYDAVTYRDLRTNVGVDLWRDEELLTRLQSDTNPNVHVNMESQTVNYVTAIGVKKKLELEEQLNKHKSGVLLLDLKDESYEGVELDVASLVRDGKVLAVNGTKVAKTLLYPRTNKNIMVKLPGTISVINGSRFVRTEEDLRDFVRRGDLVVIHRGKGTHVEQRFRVSTACLDGDGIHAAWECQLNAASSSVPSTTTIPGRCFPFTASVMPLDRKNLFFFKADYDSRYYLNLF